MITPNTITVPLYKAIDWKWQEGPCVYLLHFSERLAGHAQHYIGFCTDRRGLMRRVTQHQRGRGARITAAAVGAGIELHLVAIWHGNRAFERRLKRQKNAAALCPVCRERRRRAAATGDYVQLDFADLLCEDFIIPF